MFPGRSAVLRHWIAEAFRGVIRDVQDLLGAEVRLAKAEVSESVDRAKRAGGLIGAAAAVGLFAGISLFATCIAALATAMPVWAAGLIMTDGGECRGDGATDLTRLTAPCKLIPRECRGE
jgi:hypothetical protein